MHAILLSIGDELALGQTVDTNSAWLAQRLARLGIFTREHLTVADDRAAIAAAFTHAATRADLVIATGGLGPTDDDLTREALADAMGVTLEPNDDALAALRQFFARRDKPMPERNRVQAMCPVGASLIDNKNGTAPGLRATLHGAEVFVAPGVPREMFAMYDDAIEPAVQRFAGTAVTLITTKVNTFGLGESDAAQRLGTLMARDRNPTVGTTVSGGICSARVRAEYTDAAEARRQLDDTVAQVEAALHPFAFGRDDTTLEEAVVALLNERNLTVAVAESCTGGMLGAALTDVPGSSSVFLGGWVTYANDMKVQLGVDASLIEQHGAVSEPVVRAMAEHAQRRSGADYALAITGIAGPDGGTDLKPVGTVWIALAGPDGTDARLAKLIGTRASIRDRATKCALQLLRLAVLGENPDEIMWLATTPATA